VERTRDPHGTPEFQRWLSTLSGEKANRVTAAMDALRDGGTTMGRPLVDRVTGSRLHNMKELRTGSIRVLFVFHRRAPFMLVGGDKRGAWNDWYQRAIPEADRLYNRYRGDDGKEGAGWRREPPGRGR
jgi:hypothetical protein